MPRENACPRLELSSTGSTSRHSNRTDGADFGSCSSRYGWGIDVRATYADLPCQWFWTWLTGKYPIRHEPRRPVETLLAPWQLGLQLLWSWGLIVASLVLGALLYSSPDIGVVTKVVCTLALWVIVTNRTRGLLHTFHYTNHGASIRNQQLARFLGKWFMSIPVMHLTWDEYHRIHAGDHHASTSLCTEDDPDEQFMTDHGFYPGMPERLFWQRLVLAPFHPRAIWNHILFRLRHNFVIPARSEIISRIAFWVAVLSVVAATGTMDIFLIYYMVPLFLVTQYSSWLQHTTEHLWFATRPADVPPFVFYASLTWGRFLGRPYPRDERGYRGLLLRGAWWAQVFLVDLPVKLFSFMQDLPSHDFHHRSPRVNFWSIARERAAAEGLPSKYGPMAETWSLLESWKVVRDQVCYGETDAFGIWKWARERERSARQVNQCPLWDSAQRGRETS